jgi:Raf kinase inhibitor-like YbhB/YbcL family protein
MLAELATMAFVLSSPAFGPNAPIPKQHTCEGADVSPPLQWSGAPEGTRSLVLIVDDPDAPDPRAPKTTWVHWLLYNIPADVTELAEDEKKNGVPSGALSGLNDWKRTGYGGPCPPIGRHRYFHKLYALDTVLSGLDRPTKQHLLDAMKGHILGEAQLVGTYEKSR